MSRRYIDSNELINDVPNYLQNIINNMDCVYVDGIEPHNQHFNLTEHDEEVRADERAKVIDELKPFFDEVAEYTLDWICDDLCGEFINPITDECWCAEHCNNGTGYECIKKWCELKE